LRAPKTYAMTAIPETLVTSEVEICPACRGRGISEESPGWCGIEGGGSVLCPSCRGTGRLSADVGGTAP
jgi:DnaJ-class molecular chaperone